MTIFVWAAGTSGGRCAGPDSFVIGDPPDEFRVQGVLCTANPHTLATDELLVTLGSDANADWMTIATTDLRVRRSAGACRSMSDAERTTLAELGRALSRNARRLPVRLEWRWSADRLYVTRCESLAHLPFCWDEDVDAWQKLPEDPRATWTLQWAKDAWNGATTPLHYSIVARELEEGHVHLRTNLGATEMLKVRLFKYWRGRAYYNTRVDAMHAVMIAPSTARTGLVGNVHPDDRPAVLAAPLDRIRLLRVVLRQLRDPASRPFSWIRRSYDYMRDVRGNAGLSPAGLAALGDAALVDYIESRIEHSSRFNAQMWLGFYTYGTWAMLGLTGMLRSFLSPRDDRSIPSMLQELISGLPLPPPVQARERQALWSLADEIRRSPELRTLALSRAPRDFHAALPDSDEGRRFLERYREFLDEFGDRGSEDRDIYYARRGEDPALDLLAFRLVSKAGGGVAPEELARRRRDRRERLTKSLRTEIRRERFGWIKSTAFLTLLRYVHRFLRLRDDQRHSYDVMAMAKKRGLEEIGRRLVSRGLLEVVGDIYFLSWPEMQDLFLGTVDRALLQAAINGRRIRFERVYSRADAQPFYIRDGAPVDADAPAPRLEPFTVGDRMPVAGTSTGQATGRARLVPHLSALDRVEPGEILVCTNTDPGWTAAFFLIGGLVLEEGGLLAPGACMAREHGIPAVTIPDAMTRIIDGATIRIDGGAGSLEVLRMPSPGLY